MPLQINSVDIDFLLKKQKQQSGDIYLAHHLNVVIEAVNDLLRVQRYPAPPAQTNEPHVWVSFADGHPVAESQVWLGREGETSTTLLGGFSAVNMMGIKTRWTHWCYCIRPEPPLIEVVEGVR